MVQQAFFVMQQAQRGILPRSHLTFVNKVCLSLIVSGAVGTAFSGTYMLGCACPELS